MTTSTRSTTAIAFALTPGLLHADDIIDLNSKLGRDIYTRATAPLKTFFDGDSKNINLFQNQLKRKTENAGWGTGTGNIIHIKDAKGNSRNLSARSLDGASAGVRPGGDGPPTVRPRRWRLACCCASHSRDSRSRR